MSAYAVVPLLSPPETEPILFLSLPEPVHKNIVRFIGGGGDNVPDSYGASLIELAGVMISKRELLIVCNNNNNINKTIKLDYFTLIECS